MPNQSQRTAFGTKIDRLRAMVRGTRPDGPRSDPLDLDGPSPEQRILDTAARYRDLRPTDVATRRPGPDQRRGAVTSTNGPLTEPTEPNDAEGPIWIRRLDGKMAVMPTLPGNSLPVRTANGPDRAKPAPRR